eukprot:CAMPEP_0167778574 /NCGR_PEP_ID=MMETSP0111_2-20121227/4328_1 /TAXON_ID=91324 /ORGANISM="Lotharella globosa, Strain CCCM811" /LENGTH=121 /DNA_ID=CAMNT_0007668891 /DNA_START=21 /DNA_END=387 /DNA_ORIENTATION=+
MPKREFDRRSGTGRGKEIRKQGAGKGGWGTANDDLVMMNEPGVFGERKSPKASGKEVYGTKYLDFVKEEKSKASGKEVYGTKYLDEVMPNINKHEVQANVKHGKPKKTNKMSLAAFQAIGS